MLIILINVEAVWLVFMKREFYEVGAYSSQREWECSGVVLSPGSEESSLPVFQNIEHLKDLHQRGDYSQ